MKTDLLLMHVKCARCGFEGVETPLVGTVTSQRLQRMSNKAPQVWICTTCMEELL